jgi:hypothetical protein
VFTGAKLHFDRAQAVTQQIGSAPGVCSVRPTELSAAVQAAPVCRCGKSALQPGATGRVFCTAQLCRPLGITGEAVCAWTGGGAAAGGVVEAVAAGGGGEGGCIATAGGGAAVTGGALTTGGGSAMGACTPATKSQPV